MGHGALRGKPGPVYARLYEAYQRAKQIAVDLKAVCMSMPHDPVERR